MQDLILLGLLFARSLALPTRNHVVHEKRDAPLGHPRQRLDPDAIIPIRIALRQSNLHIGHDRLMDVSHPSSPNYGKHLSAEEVHSLFAPAEASFNAVKNWLLDSGLDESDILHYENKGWLGLDIPASRAEDLLNTEYYEYEEKASSHRIGCDVYSLPAHLSEHVDFVKPGIKLSAPLRKRTVKRNSAGWPSGGRPGWPRPPHSPSHPWPHWQPPASAHGLPPDLRNCGVNIT
jgi:tripeptidyl-peptidase-1